MNKPQKHYVNERCQTKKEYVLDQWSLTFLAPETSFSTDGQGQSGGGGGGVVKRQSSGEHPSWPCS